jgi:hypothetical protein
MYAKLFSSLIASSLWSEDDKTRILFVTMLAMADWEGFVDASPAGLAPLARMSLTDCKIALEKLMSPDPESKNPDNEGRRIAKVEGGFLVLNYTIFRNKESKEYKRSQDRERQRRKRAKDKALSRNVTQCHAMSPEVAYTDTDTDTSKKKSIKRKRFVPPTLEEVKLYVMSELLNVDPIEFWKGYNDGGWVDTNGKPVRNWKLKCRTWHNRDPRTKEAKESESTRDMVRRVLYDDIRD